jgi:hypothetical protein
MTWPKPAPVTAEMEMMLSKTQDVERMHEIDRIKSYVTPLCYATGLEIVSQNSSIQLYLKYQRRYGIH